MSSKEIDRFEAFACSPLSSCRLPQLSLHFRGQLPCFNVIAAGSQNQTALTFRSRTCVYRKKRPVDEVMNDADCAEEKTLLESEWQVRYPEIRPGGSIAVPVLYKGDWSRTAVISLYFAVHNKKSQNLCYSKGEVFLIDDLCNDRLCIPLMARNEDASDELKAAVYVHLLMDVWDVDAGAMQLRNFELTANDGDHEDIFFQKVECITEPAPQEPENGQETECDWPGRTDFLIEVPLGEETSTSTGFCQSQDKCDYDENANVVQTSQHTPRTITIKKTAKFYCHQAKLFQASVAFEELFTGDWTKDANVLRLHTVNALAVQMFLNFIYNKRLFASLESSSQQLNNTNLETLLQVVSLADKYEIDKLKAHCDTLLTDRYLNLQCAAELAMIADRHELPCLGQAALSLLSWSLDEEYLRPLFSSQFSHLLGAVLREAARKHMLATVITESL